MNRQTHQVRELETRNESYKDLIGSLINNVYSPQERSTTGELKQSKQTLLSISYTL